MKKVLFLALLAAIVAGTPPRHFTNATVVLANNAGACCYRAIFIQGGTETPFLFTTSGSTSFPSALPPGTYSLGVAPLLGASGNHNYSWSCGPNNGSASGTSALFNNVIVSSGGTITVSIN